LIPEGVEVAGKAIVIRGLEAFHELPVVRDESAVDQLRGLLLEGQRHFFIFHGLDSLLSLVPSPEKEAPAEVSITIPKERRGPAGLLRKVKRRHADPSNEIGKKIPTVREFEHCVSLR